MPRSSPTRRAWRRIHCIIRWSAVVHLVVVVSSVAWMWIAADPIQESLAEHFSRVLEPVPHYAITFAALDLYDLFLLHAPLSVPVIGLLLVATRRAIRLRKSSPPGDHTASLGRAFSARGRLPRRGPDSRAHALQQVVVPVVLAVLWTEFHIALSLWSSLASLGVGTLSPAIHREDGAFIIASQLVIGTTVATAAACILAIPGGYWRYARGLGWLLMLPVTVLVAILVGVGHCALWMY